MRLTIAHKLSLAFVGLTAVLLVVTLGLARWSFERGFLDYSIALEQERLRRLAERLSEQYQQAGGTWDWLDGRAFASLLGEAGTGHRDGPPPGPPPGPLGRLTAPPPRPHLHPPRFGPPTALYDRAGRRIAGPRIGQAPIRDSGPAPDPAPDPIQEPGAVDAVGADPLVIVPVLADDREIGELRSRVPPRAFDTPQATAFSRQQWLTSGMIGVAGLLLALGLSLALARALLAPLRRAIQGVSRLADGDYGKRLDEARTDELGQLMAGVDRLAEALEANRSARRRWLADISHELRTPVTILAGEMEALKDGVRAFDEAQLLSLDQEVGRIRRLIDDLYTLSLSDAGGLRYRFEPLELAGALAAAIESARPRALEAGIELRLNAPRAVHARADALRIAQLFANLLENALAYTDAPGVVEISLNTALGTAVLLFEDSPPGVDADALARLFEPLYRPDSSRSRRRAGAGLGLAICRNIVDAHQGRLAATPSPLGGVCIRVELPVLSAEAAAAEASIEENVR